MGEFLNLNILDINKSECGLYVHVPFCAQICHYCDFAVLKAPVRVMEEWVDLLLAEMKHRVEQGKRFRTFYLGGGTPSALPLATLKRLLDGIQSWCDLSGSLENTIEVNPENVSIDFLEFIQKMGMNRLSIGIQSFNDQTLKKIGRNHNAQKAKEALALIGESQIEFSLDLMFALPDQEHSDFLKELEIALSFEPHHMSFYGLTIEDQTLFGQWDKKGVLAEPLSNYNEFYHLGVELLEKCGYHRYELSNFSRPGFESIHNRAYWNKIPYVGLGFGAHSFDGTKRLWAPKQLHPWKKQIQNALDFGIELDFEFEVLHDAAFWNEWIWLGLRQSQGIDLAVLYQDENHEEWCALVSGFVQKKWAKIVNNHFIAEGEGWIFLDEMSSDFFKSESE